MSIKIVKYTDKSCIVIGDTFAYKDQLKNFGGRWQPVLKQMPEIATKGWLFPLAKQEMLEKMIKEFQSTLSDAEASETLGETVSENSELMNRSEPIAIAPKIIIKSQTNSRPPIYSYKPVIETIERVENVSEREEGGFVFRTKLITRIEKIPI